MAKDDTDAGEKTDAMRRRDCWRDMALILICNCLLLHDLIWLVLLQKRYKRSWLCVSVLRSCLSFATIVSAFRNDGYRYRRRRPRGIIGIWGSL